MKYLFLFIMLTGATALRANDSTRHVRTGFEGQISITANREAAFVSIGGATLKYHFKRFSIGLITMPIIKFYKDPVKPFVSPGFGAGLQLYFPRNKRWIISAPFYYNNSINRWQWTAGFGYVLGKPGK